MHFPNGVIIVHQASAQDTISLDKLFNGELWFEVFLIASKDYMTSMLSEGFIQQ